jgi:hypothetical protein
VVDISFPNSILVKFSLPDVPESFAYRFWDGVTCRHVIGFLARTHFFCEEHDLTLLRFRSRVPEGSSLRLLFPPGERASLTVQMTRKLTPVRFRYVDRAYNFD